MMIFKCRIIRNKGVERQQVTIESKYGATSPEIKAIQQKEGWVVEKILINSDELIFNSFKNKGYNVVETYVPTIKNQYKEIDNYYAADVEFLGHVFLGYSVKEVKKSLSKIKDYFDEK